MTRASSTSPAPDLDEVEWSPVERLGLFGLDRVQIPLAPQTSLEPREHPARYLEDHLLIQNVTPILDSGSWMPLPWPSLALGATFRNAGCAGLRTDRAAVASRCGFAFET